MSAHATMQDLRHALRSLRAAPIVSAVAVVSLALGIGANTAIFSLIDSLLLRPLPVREPERLVLIHDSGSSSYPNRVWEAIRDRGVFEHALAWSTEQVSVRAAGLHESVEGLWTSGSFFEVLGVQPILGRTYVEADDRHGGGPDGPVAVISYDFWQRRFAGAREVLGSTIAVEGVPFSIVGVSAPGFTGPVVGIPFDIALPLGTVPLIRGRHEDLGSFGLWVSVMARLPAGVTSEAAAAALRQAQPQLREATLPPFSRAEDRDAYLREPMVLAPAGLGTSFLRRLYARPLVVLLAVTALVLLVACANVANLLLARAAGRRREFGVRVALGASRSRLFRQALGESLLLSAAGTGLGLVAGYWCSRILVRQFSVAYMGNPFTPGPTRIALDLSLDWRVLAFTVAAGAATTILFGTAPAWLAARVDPVESLGGGARTPVGAGRPGAGHALVAAQVALSLLLLVGAGLFVRTLRAVTEIPLGFEPDRALSIVADARPSGVEGPALAPLYERVREAVASVPGVARAAVSYTIPLAGLAKTTIVDVPGGAPLGERDRVVSANRVSPGWFDVLGTRLLAGRDFDARDRAGASPVAIVNEAFARRFLTGERPLGRSLRQGFPKPLQQVEIVGIVEDAIYRGTREPAPPTIYLPFAQAGPDDLLPVVLLVARPAAGSPGALVRPVTEAVGAVDPNLKLTLRTMADRVDATFNHERVLAMLASVFGGLALLLVSVGLYGVTAHTVTRRRAEIGVCVALGASRGAVVWMVFRRMVILAAIGLLAGGAASLWGARLVRTLLFGVGPGDPWILAGATALVTIVALGAAWFPVRRAMQIDPAVVLREN